MCRAGCTCIFLSYTHLAHLVRYFPYYIGKLTAHYCICPPSCTAQMASLTAAGSTVPPGSHWMQARAPMTHGPLHNNCLPKRACRSFLRSNNSMIQKKPGACGLSAFCCFLRVALLSAPLDGNVLILLCAICQIQVD